MTMQKEDIINNPHHYTLGGIEVIDIIKAKLTPDQFQGFLLGNITKRILRAGEKGNSLEDLKKAHWYLERLIDEEGKKEEMMIAGRVSENDKLRNHLQVHWDFGGNLRYGPTIGNETIGVLTEVEE